MKKIIIVSMLLITLSLASCSQKEGSKSEQANESSSQEKIENVAKNNTNEEANESNIQKENEINAKKTSNIDTTGARVITVNAKKWAFTPNKIRVKKWERVVIKINNIDVVHGIDIPKMWIEENYEFLLDTSKVWVFEFKCENYCGEGHSTMEWKIIVE